MRRVFCGLRYLNPVFYITFFTPICFGSVKSSPSSVSSSNRVVKPFRGLQKLDKSPFHPYFSIKDVFGFVVFFSLMRAVCFLFPWDIGDPENFIPANPIVTPVHIQPEWYFVFAYAILRSIPSKL